MFALYNKRKTLNLRNIHFSHNLFDENFEFCFINNPYSILGIA